MSSQPAVSSKSEINSGSLEEIGNAFIQHYYAMFDDKQKRATMGSLYQKSSMLTYVDKKYQGPDSIISHSMVFLEIIK